MRFSHRRLLSDCAARVCPITDNHGHTLRRAGCEVVSIPLDDQYKVTPEAVARFADSLLLGQGDEAGQEEGEEEADGEGGKQQQKRNQRNQQWPLKGLILSSPSNPTGAMLTPEEIREMVKVEAKKEIDQRSSAISDGLAFLIFLCVCCVELPWRPKR